MEYNSVGYSCLFPSHGAMSIAIAKNGSTLDAVYVEGVGDIYDQGSSQVTTHLAKGEQVWVRHGWGDHYVRGGLWTVFTGYLLQAE